MYSRNTSKRSGFSRVNSQKMQNIAEDYDVKLSEEVNLDKGGYNEKSSENNSPFSVMRDNMPIAPPNYRGMIYDREKVDNNAEGIDRLVRNDQSYSDNQIRVKNRFDEKREEFGKAQAFSHMRGIQNGGDNCSKVEEKGIKSLVKSMQDNTISPEDILICAIILLMLSGNSEDDIILILVLMALL